MTEMKSYIWKGTEKKIEIEIKHVFEMFWFFDICLSFIFQVLLSRIDGVKHIPAVENWKINRVFRFYLGALNSSVIILVLNADKVNI